MSYTIPSILADMYPPHWQEIVPPYCPQHALQAVSIARSYWNAKGDANTGYTFTYNQNTFLTGCPVFINGKGAIDCSTYMHLVLRGIRYKDSPYSGNNTSISTQTAYPWTAELGNFSTMGMVRQAAEIAAYYCAAGRFFDTTFDTQRRPGDLFFFKSDNANNRFLNISHVGMVAFETDKYYNVTSKNSSVVMLSNIPSESRSANDRQIVGYARPFYEMPKQPYDFRHFNFLEAPWLVKEGETQYNGIYSNCSYSSGTIWTNTKTNVPVIGGRLISLADEENELFLPAGHYILTGAPQHRDRRANVNYNYWGLRIELASNSGSFDYIEYGFSGPSYSGDPQAFSGSGSEVWDRGFGAKFHLTNSGTRVCARIHISECPVQNYIKYENLDPTQDIWQPCLLPDPDYI